MKAPVVPWPPSPRDGRGCVFLFHPAVRKARVSHVGAGAVAVTTGTFSKGISPYRWASGRSAPPWFLASGAGGVFYLLRFTNIFCFKRCFSKAARPAELVTVQNPHPCTVLGLPLRETSAETREKGHFVVSALGEELRFLLIVFFVLVYLDTKIQHFTACIKLCLHLFNLEFFFKSM